MPPWATLPPNAAAHGAVLDRQLWQSIAWMIALAVAAHVLLLWPALRRRRGARAAAPEPVARFSAPDAVLIGSIAVLFAVLVLRAESLWAANRFQGASPGAMQVEVVGQQFQWYFRYPGVDARYGATRPALADAGAGNALGLDGADVAAKDDIVASELVLPVGREVDLRLRSHDVIHGFFVPAMRVKQNALPGSVLHVHFTPTQAGEYPIVCTQVCGTGHYRMGAVLRVLSEADFARWMAVQRPVLGGSS